MSRDLYWVACALAGAWRHGYLPDGINLLSADPKFPRVRKAIYIACDRSGDVAYVGKVTRAESEAVRNRLGEHVRNWAKAQGWATLYVVPLSRNTPAEVVLELEGAIGRRLTPTGNLRLPQEKSRSFGRRGDFRAT